MTTFFRITSSMDGESCRYAYDALLEYQNNPEPGAEDHKEIEPWARPMMPAPPAELEKIKEVLAHVANNHGSIEDTG
jgi:hypothetical protein